MASNAQKTPIARTLNQFVGGSIGRAMSMLGPQLPASVVAVVSSGIVTVKFELTGIVYTLPQITVPILGSEYVRLPIQQGMKGWVMSADAYLGGMSGLGGGTANLTRRGNLSALVFSPIGNSNWSATDDPNSVVIYGPDGVIIRDLSKKNVLTVSSTEVTLAITAGSLIITVPNGQTVTINGNGIVNGNWQVNGNLELSGNIENATGGTYAGAIQTTGDVVANAGVSQVSLQNHTHTQPADSHGDTEGPTSAPTPGT